MHRSNAQTKTGIKEKETKTGQRRDGLSEAAARVCPAVVGSSCAAGRPVVGQGGSSGDAVPLTSGWRTIAVQPNRTWKAPLSRSPKTQLSCLAGLNWPK